MKVQALDRGYDGRFVREKGEVFEFEGKLGKWMKPVGAVKADASEPVVAPQAGEPSAPPAGAPPVVDPAAAKAAEKAAKAAAKAAEKAAKKK